MKNGFQVIDADRHIVEPMDLGERLGPAFAGRVQLKMPAGQSTWHTSGLGVGVWEVDGKSVCHPPQFWGRQNPRYEVVFKDGVESGFSAASNLAAMDREGVDIAVHYPSAGLLLIWRDDIPTDLSVAICRAYNDWLAEFSGADPARQKGIALIPLQDPDLAAAELRRAVTELGFVGGLVRPNPLRGRLVNDPAYDTVYRTADELGVPVAIHEGAITTLPQVGSDRFTSFGRHIVVHPMEQMMACLAFTTEGLLERFPTLKVAHLEAGCGWLPFWMDRIDEHWEKREHWGGEGAGGRRPSDIFRAQCVISAEAGDDFVPDVVEHLGDDILVLATDYPHSDALDTFPDRTVGDLVSHPKLSETTKRKILWDNPARLYGITAPAGLFTGAAVGAKGG
jgi:predicted TIM-barrel fold metal-dependent hydrolase